MKVEVIYQAVPYKVEEGIVKFQHRDRTLCMRVLEVKEFSEIYGIMLIDKGFSNNIVSTRILKDDETYDEESNKALILKKIKDMIDNKGLSTLVADIKKQQSNTNIENLNLTIKSWK